MENGERRTENGEWRMEDLAVYSHTVQRCTLSCNGDGGKDAHRQFWVIHVLALQYYCMFIHTCAACIASERDFFFVKLINF